jgi:hypothetical protein
MQWLEAHMQMKEANFSPKNVKIDKHSRKKDELSDNICERETNSNNRAIGLKFKSVNEFKKLMLLHICRVMQCTFKF